VHGVVAFAGEAADGVGIVPEIAEGLALDDFEEGGVGEIFDDANGGDGRGVGWGGL